MTVYSRILPVRDGVIFVKPSEMINPQDIVQLETIGKAGNPPFIIRLPVVIPAVERISPELTCSGEAIRRAACYSKGYILLI